jgi:hypothetical protein
MDVLNLRSTFLLFAAAALAACGGGGGGSSGGGPTAPPPTVQCSNLAGTWHSSWVMDCGPDAKGGGDVIFSQSNCSVSFSIPGLGQFAGNLVGNQSSPNLVLNFAATAPGAGSDCKNVSEGGLRVQADGSLALPFGSDPPPCCRHGNVTFNR